jgi:regulator of sigma E protease
VQLEWYQIIIGVLVGLVGLTILVILHELGHAYLARRNGVKVEEFGVGFPPRAKVLGRQRGTLITLNWLLPLGGFCRLKGESDAAREKGSYGAASYGAKTKILLAGVTANLLTTILIFTILSLFGMPKVFEGQFTMPGDEHISGDRVTVQTVVDGLPAHAAGLRAGDTITSVDGQPTVDSAQIPALAMEKRDQTIRINYQRCQDQACTDAVADVKLRGDNNDGRGYLGLSAGQNIYLRSTWSAPIVGTATTGQFVWLTLQGLGELLSNFAGGIIGSLSPDSATRDHASASLAAAGDSVSGPVGILGVIFPNTVSRGATQLAFLVGIISLTLAIMNLLPIPGLDGGRWLLTTIFRLIKKPLTEELEGKINGIGMMCLFGLIILITVVDVLKLW